MPDWFSSQGIAGYQGEGPGGISGRGVQVPQQPQLTDHAPGFSSAPLGSEQYVRDFFASRGVTPRDGTPSYYAQKWASGAFGSDPNYLVSQLGRAEELPENAGAGQRAATAPAIAGPQPTQVAQNTQAAIASRNAATQQQAAAQQAAGGQQQAQAAATGAAQQQVTGAQQNAGASGAPNYNGGPMPPSGTADPFQGKGVWTGQGWAPVGHPDAQAAVAQFSGATTGANGQPTAAQSPGLAAQMGQTFTPDGPFKYQDFNAPAPFQAPTREEAANDPGYQFAVQQQQRALTNSAASRGLLRSTNTLQDFQNLGQQMASDQYDKVYGRSLNTYQTNYNNAFGANQANNQGRAGAFGANVNAGLGYGNLALGQTTAANSYALGQGQLALGNKSADQNYALGQGQLTLGQGQLALGNRTADQNYSLGLGQLGLGQGQLALQTQGQNFNQGFSLADLGLRATQTAGGYGSIYGQNSANNATGAGNAAAAGAVGSGNAWTGGIQGIGNAAANAYGMYQYGQQQRRPIVLDGQ